MLKNILFFCIAILIVPCNILKSGQEKTHIVSKIMQGNTILCVPILCTDPLIFSVCDRLFVGLNEMSFLDAHQSCTKAMENTRNFSQKTQTFTRGSLGTQSLKGADTNTYLQYYFRLKDYQIFFEDYVLQKDLCQSIKHKKFSAYFDDYAPYCSDDHVKHPKKNKPIKIKTYEK